jgi:hypothetical protein
MKNDISLQSRLDTTALVMNRIIILISISATFTSAFAADSDRKIDFNRDIRPILSNHCWNCHGQDTESRKAGLRLDLREEALKRLKSDEHAIVPGKPDESSLLERVDSTKTAECQSAGTAATMGCRRGRICRPLGLLAPRSPNSFTRNSGKELAQKHN